MAKSNNINKPKKEEMSFLDHLEELRWHLIRSAFACLIFMVIAFFNRSFIYDVVILSPKNPDFITNRLFAELGIWLNSIFNIDAAALAINKTPLNIVNIDMAGQFMSHMKISLVSGLILASPYIIWEIWSFIKPALYANEKKHASGAVFFITLLFITGILFGYYIIAPLSISFLGSYVVSEEIQNTIKLSSYVGTITSVTFASGVIFELPMVVLFLSKIGLMTPSFMRKYRRHAYIVLLIIAAIITPPDVFSQTLVAIPLIILYEISVFISRSVIKKKERLIKEEEAESRRNQPTKNTNIKDDETFERTFLDGSDDEK